MVARLNGVVGQVYTAIAVVTCLPAGRYANHEKL